MKHQLVYKKPSIKTKKIKINFFNTTSRLFDSFDELLAPHVFAQSGTYLCFLAGTKILLADKTAVAIEAVSEGQEVISYDLKNKSFVTNVVEDKIVHYGDEKGYFVINGILKVTGNHLLWNVREEKWQAAESLKVGDVLLGNNEEHISIDSLEHVEGTYDVYNVHLKASPHNFFADGILSHNTTGPGGFMIC